MDRKTLTAIALGVLAAGVLCILAGVIVYFTANHNPGNMLIGLFMIFAGCAMAVIPLIVLLVILIINLVQKSKNN